jgi:hypothetical protein
MISNKMYSLKFLFRSIGINRFVPLRPPVTPGLTYICVSGFKISHHTGRACEIAKEIAKAYPEYKTWFYFDSPSKYRKFLKIIKGELSLEDQNKFKNHKTSPFCWLETSEGKIAIGGRDRLCEWVNNSEKFEKDFLIKKLTTTDPKLLDAFFDNTNSP